MAHRLLLQQTSWRTLERVQAMIRTVARVVASEHALALRAAAKAASPRESLDEVRALYVPPGPHQDETASLKKAASVSGPAG